MRQTRRTRRMWTMMRMRRNGRTRRMRPMRRIRRMNRTRRLRRISRMGEMSRMRGMRRIRRMRRMSNLKLIRDYFNNAMIGFSSYQILAPKMAFFLSVLDPTRTRTVPKITRQSSKNFLQFWGVFGLGHFGVYLVGGAHLCGAELHPSIHPLYG